MKILLLLALFCGVLISVSKANGENITLLESRIVDGSPSTSKISVGFILEVEIRKQMCTVTALEGIWFITVGECLDEVKFAEMYKEKRTFAVYFAGTNNDQSLTKVSIGHSQHFRRNYKLEDDYWNLDIGVFVPVERVTNHHPAPLNFDDDLEENQEVKILGWQHLAKSIVDSCRTKDEIREITYIVTDPMECQNFYIQQHPNFEMRTEMACIKTLSPDKFLDKADIGGPVLQDGKLRAIVAYTNEPHDPIIVVKTKHFTDDECI